MTSAELKFWELCFTTALQGLSNQCDADELRYLHRQENLVDACQALATLAVTARQAALGEAPGKAPSLARAHAPPPDGRTTSEPP